MTYPLVIRRLLRWRFVLAFLLSILFGFFAQVPWRFGIDWSLLSRGASVLFSRQGGHVYALVGGLQAGPISLVPVRLLNLIPDGNGLVLDHLLLYAEFPLLLWLTESMVPDRNSFRVQFTTLLCGFVVAPVWELLAGLSPHIDDGMALLGAALAMRFVAKDRWWQAAVMVGLAAGAKPWAIGSLALLLGLRSRRVRAFALAVAVTALPWLILGAIDHRNLTAAAGYSSVAAGLTPIGALHLFSGPAPHYMRSVELFSIATIAVLVAYRRGWQYAFGASMIVRLFVELAFLGYYDADTMLAVATMEISTRQLPWRTFVLRIALQPRVPVSIQVMPWLRIAGLSLVLLDLLRRTRPTERVPGLPAQREQQESQRELALLAS